MTKKWRRSSLYMDTVVSLTVATSRSEAEVDESMARAFDKFRLVEDVCSRFDHQSELMCLIRQVGTPVKVSNLLFEALRFSWEVAELTHGIFDPSIGRLMETYGFQRHYLTGEKIDSGISSVNSVCYQDIILNKETQTVCLQKPLVLDLGAVAKGLAVDLAARELSHFEGFVIDAGGDIYIKGEKEQVKPYVIGIQHPVNKMETICSFYLSDTAVCTSGSYERVSPLQKQIHHLILPQNRISSSALVSCTVIAPFTMMADAFSTAAFLLGPNDGLALLEQVGLDGVLITPSLDVHMTKGMEGYLI